jgi:hypothetical protein
VAGEPNEVASGGITHHFHFRRGLDRPRHHDLHLFRAHFAPSIDDHIQAVGVMAGPSKGLVARACVMCACTVPEAAVRVRSVPEIGGRRRWRRRCHVPWSRRVQPASDARTRRAVCCVASTAPRRAVSLRILFTRGAVLTRQQRIYPVECKGRFRRCRRADASSVGSRRRQARYASWSACSPHRLAVGPRGDKPSARPGCTIQMSASNLLSALRLDRKACLVAHVES